MNINLIAAIGENYELGKDNNLVWRLKEDLNFFENTTMGHPIVMGRKTFESLPKVLPGRKNIVMYTCFNENAKGFYEKIGMTKPDDVMVFNEIEWTNFKVE